MVAVAAPNRVVPVLRHALTTLLAEEPVSAAHKPVVRRQRNRWTGDIEAWAPLRDKVLVTLAARGMSRRALADAVKIPHGTLKPCLLPSGRAPGRANIERLRNWADQQELAIGNQAAVQIDAVHNGNGDSNGHAGPLIALPRRLTRDQRARLAGYAELDGRTLRKTAGVAVDQIEQAIAGAELGGEVYGRLFNFLQQPEP